MKVKYRLKQAIKNAPFGPSLAGLMGFGGPRLRALSLLPKGGIGAEIGVHEGEFSRCILDIARPRQLLLIDPWRAEEDEVYKDSWYGGSLSGQKAMDGRFEGVQRRFASHIKTQRIRIMRENSDSALSSLPDNFLDFVYVDGNHLYDYVISDLKLSFQKLKPGGFITGDDYGPGSWWKGGVKRAVDEFGWNEGVSLVWIIGTQFVLRKS